MSERSAAFSAARRAEGGLDLLLADAAVRPEVVPREEQQPVQQVMLKRGFSCLWVFVSVGRGTPGPWDAPRRFMAAGPYRWVRNPMYISALLVVLGEAWLFLSLPLLGYGGALAAFFHLFVIGYEEPILGRTFGETYEAYRQRVPRWIPRARPWTPSAK